MRIVALVSVLLLVVANGESRDHKCTCQRYRDMCNQGDVGAGRCCSTHGYCGSTDCPPDPAAVRTGLLVAATYNNDHNLIPQASVHENMSVAWRRSHGWVSSCMPSTVETDRVQGRQCLKVTNSENGKEAVVRIVEKECRSSNTRTSLELDYVVFQRLDQSGNRNNVRGHLPVSYYYVYCIE